MTDAHKNSIVCSDSSTSNVVTSSVIITRLHPPLGVGTASEENKNERFEECLEEGGVLLCRTHGVAQHYPQQLLHAVGEVGRTHRGV